MGFGIEDLLDYGGGEIASEAGVIRHPETREGDHRDVKSVIRSNKAMRKTASEDPEVLDKINRALEDFNSGKRDLFTGLENHILDPENRIYYIDEHQHALTAWLASYHDDIIEGDTVLLHLDRHYDLVDPEPFEPPSSISEAEAVIADKLSNDEFILPAIQWGIVDDWKIWGTEGDIETGFFHEEFDYDSVILDLDLDVFTSIENYLVEKAQDPESAFSPRDYEPQMDYFYEEIAELIEESDFATVAFSPGYVCQDKAMMHMENVMQRYESGK